MISAPARPRGGSTESRRPWPDATDRPGAVRTPWLSQRGPRLAGTFDRYCGLVHIAFRGSPRSSLGVEWELDFVDRETGELRSGASEILTLLAAHTGTETPKAKHQVLESCVEVMTRVRDTVDEAIADLQETVAEVRDGAAALGLELMCSGSHPTTDWATQQISPNPRYSQLIEHMQWMARQLQIFGVHVHVGVRSGKKAVSIVNALTSYMPHLLALSASSPYWIGTDTGLASYRSKVFEGLPTAGPPNLLSGWPQFETPSCRR